MAVPSDAENFSRSADEFGPLGKGENSCPDLQYKALARGMILAQDTQAFWQENRPVVINLVWLLSSGEVLAEVEANLSSASIFERVGRSKWL